MDVALLEGVVGKPVEVRVPPHGTIAITKGISVSRRDPFFHSKGAIWLISDSRGDSPPLTGFR
jgi:hypothetical protein